MVEVGSTVYFIEDNRVVKSFVYAIRTVVTFRGSVAGEKHKLTKTFGEDGIVFSTEYGHISAHRCFLSKEELIKSL